MDHAHYAYSARPARGQPAVREPLRACAVLCLEHWEALPAEGQLRDPRFVGEFGSFTPDYRSWTQREYGLRIGVFRVIEALRAAGIRPAVAANARAVQRLPELVRTFNDWGCEWLGHGWAANDMMHSRLPLAQQREHIHSALATLRERTGQAVAGWMSQDWGTTPDTFALLAEAGLRYTLDWTNDDEPYLLHTTPPLCALPANAEWDDVQAQWLRQLPPREHTRAAMLAFERLRQEGQARPRGAVFTLVLHPWVCGMASRIPALRELLAALRRHDDVPWLSPGEICQPHLQAPVHE